MRIIIKTWVIVFFFLSACAELNPTEPQLSLAKEDFKCSQTNHKIFEGAQDLYKYNLNFSKLQWLPNGSGLVFDSGWGPGGSWWFFDPYQKKYQKFLPQYLTEEDYPFWRFQFNPAANQIWLRLIGKSAFKIIDTQGKLLRDIQIPNFLGGSEEPYPNDIFWLNDKEIYLIQKAYINREKHQSCHIYDVEKDQWHPASGACLAINQSSLEEIINQDSNVFFLYNREDGCDWASVYRRMNDQWVKMENFPVLGGCDLSTPGTVEYGYQLSLSNEDADQFYILSSCNYFPYPGFKNLTCQTRDDLYAWSRTANSIQGLAKDFPPGSLLSPKEDRVAFIKGDSLCTAKFQDVKKCSFEVLGEVECTPFSPRTLHQEDNSEGKSQ